MVVISPTTKIIEIRAKILNFIFNWLCVHTNIVRYRKVIAKSFKSGESKIYILQGLRLVQAFATKFWPQKAEKTHQKTSFLKKLNKNNGSNMRGDKKSALQLIITMK